MNRYNCRPPIRVLQEVVASLHSDQNESRFVEGPNHFRPRRPW